jgi:putative tricarboxylic transport membrane protein
MKEGIAWALVLMAAAMPAQMAISFHAWAQTTWKPTHPVQLVAQSAPGGGTDLTARMIQKIWQEHKDIIGQPVTVVNKAGGGGSVASSYMQSHQGDGHYLEVASTALLTSHITGASPYNYTDFTTVAMLASEYLAFAVRPDSPIKTGQELIDALKKDPTALSFAIGTAAGGVNNAAAAAVAKAAGVDPRKLKTVVFSSSAESAFALLGGHVDVVVASASEVTPFLPDRMRLIAITAPTRVPGKLALVPTWKEQGQDIISDNSRPLIGPPGMTKAELAFWDKALTKTTQTAEWKNDVAANEWANDFMTSTRAREYLDAQYASLKETLAELGMAK